MKPDDTEWAAWVSDFKDSKAVHAPPPALVNRVRRETRRHWLAVAVEVATSVGLVGLYAVTLSARPHPVLAVLAVASIAFVVAWLWKLVATYRRTWRAPGATTRAFLAWSRERRAADVRWRVFVQRCVSGMAVFGVVWGAWKLAVDWRMYRAEPWRGVVGFGGYYALLALLAWSQGRALAAARRELAELDALIREADASEA